MNDLDTREIADKSRIIGIERMKKEGERLKLDRTTKFTETGRAVKMSEVQWDSWWNSKQLECSATFVDANLDCWKKIWFSLDPAKAWLLVKNLSDDMYYRLPWETI
jgi:hypothetical protein